MIIARCVVYFSGKRARNFKSLARLIIVIGSNRVIDFKSAECEADWKLSARVPLKCTTKISPGPHNFQRPFPMGLSLEGLLYMEQNLRYKIDRASLFLEGG